MRTNCGCQQNNIEPFEFEIKNETIIYPINCNLPNTSNNFDELQDRIICDFQKIIKQLECGIQPDLEIILEEISLIFMNTSQYNVIKEVKINSSENDYLLNINDDLWDDIPTEGHINRGVSSDSLYNLFLKYMSKSEVSEMYSFNFQMFSGDYSIEQLENIIETNQYLKNLNINKKDFDISFNQDDYLYIITKEPNDKLIRADLNGFEIPFDFSTIEYNNKTYNIYKSTNRYNEGTYNIDING